MRTTRLPVFEDFLAVSPAAGGWRPRPAGQRRPHEGHASGARLPRACARGQELHAGWRLCQRGKAEARRLYDRLATAATTSSHPAPPRCSVASCVNRVNMPRPKPCYGRRWREERGYLGKLTTVPSPTDSPGEDIPLGKYAEADTVLSSARWRPNTANGRRGGTEELRIVNLLGLVQLQLGLSCGKRGPAQTGAGRATRIWMIKRCAYTLGHELHPGAQPERGEQIHRRRKSSAASRWPCANSWAARKTPKSPRPSS